jgi:hypothetical protein
VAKHSRIAGSNQRNHNPGVGLPARPAAIMSGVFAGV